MRRLQLVAVLIVVALPTAAAAQPEAYDARIAEAVAEFDAHRFAEARALFEDAHSLWPNARTLRGIGLAAFELSDYPAAHRALTASLAHEVRPLTPAQNESVAALLERTDRFLARYTFVPNVAEAAIVVDGEAVAPGEEVLLGLGEHVVDASAGPQTVRRTFTVSGGEESTMTLELAPATSEALEESDDPLPEASLGAAPAADLVPSFVLLGVGGGITLVGLVTGLGWWLPRQDAVGECASVEGTLRCGNQAELDSARDAAAGTTLAAVGVGLATLVAGVVLLASGPSDSSGAGVACGSQGLGLQCRGRF